MSWLLRDNWLGSLLAFFLGAAITWFLLDRHRPATAVSTAPAQDPAAPEPHLQQPPDPQTPTPATRATQPAPPQRTPAEPASADPPAAAAPADAAPSAPPVAAARVEFSQLMDAEPTLFDEIQPAPETAPDDDVPPGRYGEGSADAVPHQGPPDGFTIKGNAQSMLFHTPDSPYYGRTKPEVWFRTEADAERAGFTKYARRPRKATNPRD